MEGNIRYNIDRAREAQQEHEQKHDVQLEIDDPSDTVLGYCPHGVNLDKEFCPKGCRV